MSLISTGFDGSVQEPEVAQMLALASGGGTVLGTPDWKVSAVAGNRRVAIAPGTGYDAFVYATETASTLLDLTIPTTQTSGGRWFLICAERDWTKNQTRFVVLVGAAATGTAAPKVTNAANWGFSVNNSGPVLIPRAYPTTFQSSPGRISHQPIAWVYATVSSTALTVVDLRRVPARGVRIAPATLVIQSDRAAGFAIAPRNNLTPIRNVVSVTDYTPVLVTIDGRWAATGSVAGSHWVEQDGVPIGPRARLHNDGAGALPMPLASTFRTNLHPGDNAMTLVIDNESLSTSVRNFADVQMTIYEL